MKILIGYDGSDCARAAITDLKRAGLPPEGEAVVMSVADLLMETPFPVPGSPQEATIAIPPAIVMAARERAAEAVQEARLEAAEGADLLRAILPNWSIEPESVAGSPHWALIVKAEQWNSDLIVVGSRGRSMLGRLFLGSVSQGVLHHSPCSVRVGRCSGGPAEAQQGAEAPVRLVLGLDGSVESATACEAVRLRSWPQGTEVRVVTVANVKLITAMAAGAELGHGEVADPLVILRCRVNAAAAELVEAGLGAVGVVVDGDPKRLLLEEATRYNADCIVLGAKGHSLGERFRIGSVSAAVAARAHCSVEVVRTR